MTRKVLVLLAAALAGLAAEAGELRLRPLPWQEQAYYGATHAAVLDGAALTNGTTNAAQTVSLQIGGPCVWRFAGAVLDEPFDASGVTNAVGFTVEITGTPFTNAAVCADASPAQRAWAPGTAWTGVTNGAVSAVSVSVSAPGAGVRLRDVDKGRLRLFFRVLR